MNVAQENDTVLLIAGDRKRYLVRLRAGDRFHTHKGVIEHDAHWPSLGRQVTPHLNHPFVVLRPSIYDLLMNLKRASQVIYPKEITRSSCGWMCVTADGSSRRARAAAR